MNGRHGTGLRKMVCVPLVLALVSGCASPGVKKMDTAFMQSLRDTGKTTIMNHVSLHTEQRYGGGLVGAMAAVTVDAINYSKEDLETLDNRCIAAIEQVLLIDKGLHYTSRANLGLSGPSPSGSNVTEYYGRLRDKTGVTAFLNVTLFFGVEPGFKKHIKLDVTWEIMSPEDKKMVKVNTTAISDTAEEVFPNTKDPRYGDVFVLLATRNAEQFVRMLGY